MGSTPEELKSEIDQRREDLAADVDALADRVNPAHVARRGAGRVALSAVGVKDRVLGSASDAGGSVASTTGALTDKAGSLAGAGRNAPQAVKGRTQGNPLAAGVVAFGVGLLLASLAPSSRVEEAALAEAEELTEPVRDALTSAVGDVQSTLTESAKDSAHEVAGSVSDAVDATRSAVRDGAAEIGGDTRDAAGTTKQHAREAVDSAKP